MDWLWLLLRTGAALDAICVFVHNFTISSLRWSRLKPVPVASDSYSLRKVCSMRMPDLQGSDALDHDEVWRIMLRIAQKRRLQVSRFQLTRIIHERSAATGKPRRLLCQAYFGVSTWQVTFARFKGCLSRNCSGFARFHDEQHKLYELRDSGPKPRQKAVL